MPSRSVDVSTKHIPTGSATLRPESWTRRHLDGPRVRERALDSN
jgi:hypothetical protein